MSLQMTISPPLLLHAESLDRLIPTGLGIPTMGLVRERYSTPPIVCMYLLQQLGTIYSTTTAGEAETRQAHYRLSPKLFVNQAILRLDLRRPVFAYPSPLFANF